jgi:AcrR family transcriptional regulator
MGRKSLAEIRRGEILAAFERCITRYGMDVSLELVADEAGMRRSIIRHYIGNRDVLVNQLIERIAQGYLAQIEDMLGPAADALNVETLLDTLFQAAVDYNASDKIVVEVVLSAKERYPQSKERLLVVYNTFVERLAKALENLFPQAGPERCRQTAYGVVCLSQMNESLLWLGINPLYNQSARESAWVLIRSLEK